MPTPTAGRLNRPLITFNFVLNGASGSSVLPKDISAPAPFAHQCLLLMPLPMNTAAKRCGYRREGTGGVSGPAGDGEGEPVDSRARSGSESKNGSAISTPAPRRERRRETASR